MHPPVRLLRAVITMNRLTLPLLVVSLALAGLSTWLFMERGRQAGRVTELEAAAAGYVTRVATLEAAAASKAVMVEAARKQAGEVASMKKQADAKDPGQPVDPAKAAMEGMAKMMSDPKMRDVMKSQARMGVDMMYRDLFDLLNLPEPQRTQFEKLIGQKATAGMEAAFGMMGSEKTAEQRKTAAAEVKRIMEESDAKMKELLGKEDYDKVLRYEDSQMERMQLNSFNGMLTAKDLSMDEGTEAKLMDVMFEERKKFPFAENYLDQQNPDITRFSDANTDRFNDEYGQLNSNITNRAAGILTPPQLDIFRQSQEQQRNMIQMQMEMGTKMFGGGQ